MYGHRRSLRLKDYDYAQSGAYFITICTGAGSCLFGTITGEEMHLNVAGQMVWDVWNSVPEHYPGVDADQFIVMPNHVHGIVVLESDDGANSHGHETRERVPRRAPTEAGEPARLSLPDVVHRFKSLTTARYRHGVTEEDWRRFTGTLWQRNYYEHVIRTEDELTRVREYIIQNPL